MLVVDTDNDYKGFMGMTE